MRRYNGVHISRIAGVFGPSPKRIGGLLDHRIGDRLPAISQRVMKRSTAVGKLTSKHAYAHETAALSSGSRSTRQGIGLS
jgi:hypothetical protein